MSKTEYDNEEAHDFLDYMQAHRRYICLCTRNKSMRTAPVRVCLEATISENSEEFIAWKVRKRLGLVTG